MWRKFTRAERILIDTLMLLIHVREASHSLKPTLGSKRRAVANTLMLRGEIDIEMNDPPCDLMAQRECDVVRVHGDGML